MGFLTRRVRPAVQVGADQVVVRRAAEVLRPGGLLAVFWNVQRLPPELVGAFNAVYARIAPGSPFARQGGEPLLIRRIVKADGGSRGFVNDQPAGAALLRDLAPLLVEIHGQHDDRGLLNPKGHRALLDRFGGLDIAPVQVAWSQLSDLTAQLDIAQ